MFYFLSSHQWWIMMPYLRFHVFRFIGDIWSCPLKHGLTFFLRSYSSSSYYFLKSQLVFLTFESKVLTAVVLQMSLAFWLPQITQDVAQYVFCLLSKQFRRKKNAWVCICGLGDNQFPVISRNLLTWSKYARVTTKKKKKKLSTKVTVVIIIKMIQMNYYWCLIIFLCTSK